MADKPWDYISGFLPRRRRYLEIAGDFDQLLDAEFHRFIKGSEEDYNRAYHPAEPLTQGAYYAAYRAGQLPIVEYSHAAEKMNSLFRFPESRYRIIDTYNELSGNDCPGSY